MTVHLSRVDEFALMTLDRPEALNALSFATLREIDARLDEVAVGDARALFVTGAGERAFCAGADITELMGRPLAQGRRDMANGQRIISRFGQLPMPSIALINGYAFGGGLELALACNFRLALETARLGLPEIKLGLIPGYGGTQRLPRLIGEARALEIILTGRTVNADEAERIGLVHRLADGDLIEAGKAFARELAGYGLPALALPRRGNPRARRVA
jgi:enoyl-CoA hydratase